MLAEPPPSLRSVTTGVLPGQRRRPAGPPAASDHYWRRLLPVLAVLALLTRIPSFRHPLWNPDEGYLAVQARLLAGGGTLYTTVVDRKPPLLPWLYEAAFALCGDDSLGPLRLAAVAAQLLTALALASTARRRWGDRAGRAAGVLYLLVSVGLNPEDAQAATFEVFMLPFTAAAVRCADRGNWTRAGLAVAGACLTKQTGGAALVPVLWLLWQHPESRRTSLLRTAVGVSTPIALVALLAGPSRFLFWTVTGSGAYATFAGSELHVLTRGLTNTAILAAGCAGLLPPVVRVLRIARTGAADLWLWLIASAGAVLLGCHFFGHYYLQLIPPLVLLATGALQILPPCRLTGALLTSACACALFLLWGLLAPRPDLLHTERLATAVSARTGPADRVLVWGMHPETYWLARRAPASRYLTAGLLTNYSGGRDGPQVGEKYGVDGSWPVFRAELADRPPELIVDDSRGKPYAAGRLPSLRRLLASRYERSAVVDGAVFYVRAD
ncbi:MULTISPECIES: glycosyltransferase family 39 protein [unclassified Streptomyces]|uniref:glycosyltransferase family 39 protein n=1 Tax=unclassified Streptomyces TaxID=2593676 RepID=UPI0037FA2E2D